MIPGIQFPGAVERYKNHTSIIDCTIFCLDSDKLTVNAELCGDRCGCFTQLHSMVASIDNSKCTYIHFTQNNDLSNCFDIYNSHCYSRENGIYNVSVKGNLHEVYCDMDNGGLTVIQRRYDGSVDFRKFYQDYQLGFGTTNGEHWLGLDKIHDITSSGHYEVRFDLEDFNGKVAFAEYSNFYVSASADNYRLQISGYHGNAGDGMAYHNGSYFSAGSVDNDIQSSSCVDLYQGGWWYSACHNVNINGIYNNTLFGKGINWKHWHGFYYSLKSTSMKIKPRQ